MARPPKTERKLALTKKLDTAMAKLQARWAVLLKRKSRLWRQA